MMLPALRYLIGFIFLWSILFTGFNYMVDPLQFYRKAQSPVFVKNERYQIPGLIRNYPFDTIFVGTSHSENFLASEFDQIKGTKSLNLAISGSSAWEQGQIIKMAVKQNTLTNVLWEMNYKSFAGYNPNLVTSGAFPLYLYEPNVTTPFYYLFSIDTLWMSIKNLLGRGPRVLEGLNAWAVGESTKFDGKHVVNHYCKRIENNSIKPVADYQQQLKSYLAPALNIKSKINYYLFIPPLSIANFALNNQVDKFNAFRTALYQLASKQRNVFIIDFTEDLLQISDLYNYKDVEHFSSDISSAMLAFMGNLNKKPILTTDINEVNNVFSSYVSKWRQENNFCHSDQSSNGN